MEESATYQAIVRKGRLAEARQILLRRGKILFGPADEATAAALNAVSDVEKLEELSEPILEVENWQELHIPTRRRRKGRRRTDA